MPGIRQRIIDIIRESPRHGVLIDELIGRMGLLGFNQRVVDTEVAYMLISHQLDSDMATLKVGPEWEDEP